MIEQYNPAQHGGVIESYRAISRSGTILVIFSLLVLALAAGLGYFFYFSDFSLDVGQLGIVLFWMALGLGFLFMFLGIRDLANASAFTDRRERLIGPGNNSLVSRGSVTIVRSTYKFFGRTLGTRDGDILGNVDTGWYFKVTYIFDDANGNQRRATGIIPDRLGPKRSEASQTFIDPHMPRVGQRVDVVFDDYESLILRFITPT